MIHTNLERLRSVGAIAVKRFKQATRPTNTPTVADLIIDLSRSKRDLVAENALLRQQLIILSRQKRPQLSKWDRIKLVRLARLTPNWKQALHIVQPDTLLRWHRELFRFVWRRKQNRRRECVVSHKRPLI